MVSDSPRQGGRIIMPVPWFLIRAHIHFWFCPALLFWVGVCVCLSIRTIVRLFSYVFLSLPLLSLFLWCAGVALASGGLLTPARFCLFLLLCSSVISLTSLPLSCLSSWFGLALCPWALPIYMRTARPNEIGERCAL